jgi:potassium/hydrogen antiporter
MSYGLMFAFPAALLILAVVANRLSRLTRVPDIVVLLLLGIGLGPVTHLVAPTAFQPLMGVIGMLALILILFEGGLELRLQEVVRNLPGALLLSTVCFALSVALVGAVTHLLLHFDWIDSLLIGAALGSTSGSVVLPALQQMDAPERLKVTLTLESSLGEILAVLTVGALVTISGTEALFSGLVVGFSHNVMVDLVLGVAAGVAWWKLWPRLYNQPFANTLNLGVVLALFSIGRLAGGSGLLAELIFGLTLANLPRTPHLTRIGARMVAFHAEFTFLVRSFFFVVLGVMAQVVSRSYVLPIIAILVALVIARAASVYGTRWSIRGATAADNELLFLMLPRGLITAVLALQIVNARGAAFNFLPAMAFTVVLVTNMFVVIAAFRVKPAPQIEAAASPATPALEPAMAEAAAAGAASGSLSPGVSAAEAAKG